MNLRQAAEWIGPSLVLAATFVATAHAQNLAYSTADIDATLVDHAMTTSVPDSLTLEHLEAMALSHNPTIQQASAEIRAACGAAYQAGLYPNPVVGYASDQIGAEGTAGELQGAFVSQEFVTGGKLRLSRQKYQQRASIAQTNLYAQQQRVLNDVRRTFYRTLGAQRRVNIHDKLVANGADNVQTHVEMLNLGQTTQPELLQAEVELQRDRLNLNQARNELAHTRRDLAAVVGIPDLQTADLSGALEPDLDPMNWESALGQLLSGSPELQAAWQKIRHDEIAVERERVQPIPNILVEVNGGRNFETLNNVVGVTIGIPLPIYDKNTGTIQQAQADLSRSHAEARRLELELQCRLAAQYEMYQTAASRVEDYRQTMLPKTQQAYDMLVESYKARRVAWPAVLKVERMHLTLMGEYTESLVEFRNADIAIRGMLLTGGLNQPPAPLGQGHIDAVPKPR